MTNGARRLPRTVRVGHRVIPVRRRRRLGSLGRTDRSPDRIEVDADLGRFMSLSVLVHEMVHQLDWRLSEPRVLHLEYALVTMVLSNPELFRSLSDQAPRRR